MHWLPARLKRSSRVAPASEDGMDGKTKVNKGKGNAKDG